MITTNLNFSEALQLLKNGHKMSRAGWNGKGMWVTLSPGNQVEAGAFWAPNNRRFAETKPDRTVEVLPYLTMKTSDDKIVPWLASQTDLLADDWGAVE